MIERGRAASLVLSALSDAGVALTVTAATVQVWAGALSIVGPVAATSLAPPTYALSAALVPTTEALSTEWQIEWVVTTAAGVQTYTEPAYLVRRVLLPTITDTDLLRYHRDLGAHLDPGDTTFEVQRDESWTWLEKRLITQGRRPELVMDAWQLREVHIFRTLELIFRDSDQEIGDGRYARLADYYEEQVRAAWSSLSFRYDADEDGRIAESQTRAGTSVLWAMGRGSGVRAGWW